MLSSDIAFDPPAGISETNICGVIWISPCGVAGGANCITLARAGRAIVAAANGLRQRFLTFV